MRHLKTIITLETIGPVDVSTIDLSQNPYMNVNYSETCLFWGSDSPQESRVVQTYPTWRQALTGHQFWTQPENAARAIAGAIPTREP